MKSLFFIIASLGFNYDLSGDIPKISNEKNKGYSLSIEQKVKYNDGYAKIFRFQQSDNKINYHGERISFILSDKKLLGFAKFSVEDVVSSKKELPTADESKKIALKFIEEFAPDLTQHMKVLWIKPHDEYIRLIGKENDNIRITGMKVKCRDLDSGLYFWVIIGADKQIMTFERNIKWITFPGKRGTEKWLDDAWVLENNPFK